jgi:acyl-CoA thioester hydrolase
MARPDHALLELARYPHHTTIEPRFGDLDPFRHINNVALTTFFEEARARFNRATGFIAEPPAFGMVVASASFDYLAEAGYPEPVQLGTAVAEIGRTSVTKLQLAVQGGMVVAFSRVVMVHVTYGIKAPLRDEHRDALAGWMLRA